MESVVQIIRYGILSVLVITSLILVAQAQLCRHGWHKINGRCYLVVNETSGSSNAYTRRLYCLQHNGDLANFDPAEEYKDILPNYIMFPEYYIGLTDATHEGEFRWYNNNYLPSSTTWNTDQPDGGRDENCVTVSGNPALWNDTSCDRQLPFVCQRDLESHSCGTLASTGGSMWPWQGSLKDEHGQHRCGVTLISPQWAITAASCSGFDYAVFGDSSLSDSPSEFSQGSNVTWLPNPWQMMEGGSHDLALLSLHNPVTITEYVRPACIYRTDTGESEGDNLAELTEVENCFVTGWGTLMEGGSPLNNVAHAPVTILHPSSCPNYDPGGDAPNMLCVRNDDMRGTCAGDFGGPLICQNRETDLWTLVGIIPRDFDCTDFPGVCIRLAILIPFIDATISRVSPMFRCPNGQIMMDKQICDNVVDCQDLSDELGCDPLPPGASFELDSPKFQTMSNSIFRSWLYYPQPNERLSVTFSCNSVPYYGAVWYIASASEGLSPVPVVYPSVTGNFTVFGTCPGSPIAIVIAKGTSRKQAGFQALIESIVVS